MVDSVPFKAKMSCKHGYIGHANMLKPRGHANMASYIGHAYMLNLFRKISWLSFTQS